jgi:hypothetical protein
MSGLKMNLDNKIHESFSFSCLLEVGYEWDTSEILQASLSKVESGYIKLSDVTAKELTELITIKRSEYPDELPCLFGGYKITVGDWEFMPQCCSTIENLNSWIEIIESKRFGQEHFLSEGHPTPTIKPFEHFIEISLIEEQEFGEPFWGCNGYSIKLGRLQLRDKILQQQIQMDKIVSKVKFSGVAGLSSEQIQSIFY